MDPRKLFMDERLTGICVYCGAQPHTRDHVPSKVLLDEPFPPDLPVVDACESCNAGFSLDEQYVSCFLDCVISGTVEPSGLQRHNIRRILSENPALRQRIRTSQRKDKKDNLLWQPECGRIQKVITKLARGHVAYEFYPKIEEPIKVAFAPLPLLPDQEREAFEDVTSGKLGLWPEVGSRGFFRALGKKTDQFNQIGNWIIVQPGRYRYTTVEKSEILVRIVLSEYLACEVIW